MSLETGSTEAAAETVSASESAVEVSTSGFGYSVTDPGYDAGIPEPVVDELADLKAENTKEATPSETLDDASGDDTTEETVETPADETVDSEEISDELLDRAFELGYTVEDMKSFTDAKSLEKEVSRVERFQNRLQERAGNQPAANEGAALVEEAKPEPDWDAYIEQGHDPDIVGLQKQNWQENQESKALIKQLLRTEQTRAFQAQCDRFDDAINNIGDEFKAILGTGKMDQLAKAAPEQAENRQKVFTKVNMLRNGYLTAGIRVPPEADLIQEAVHASFFKQAQTTARTKLMGDIKKAGSQSLSRPNSGGAKPLSGPSLALQKESEFWTRNSL
jgi:hypothetical protein